MLLKEKTVSAYLKIARFYLFGDLSITSLGTLYKLSRMRIKEWAL